MLLTVGCSWHPDFHRRSSSPHKPQYRANQRFYTFSESVRFIWNLIASKWAGRRVATRAHDRVTVWTWTKELDKTNDHVFSSAQSPFLVIKCSFRKPRSNIFEHEWFTKCHNTYNQSLLSAITRGTWQTFHTLTTEKEKETWFNTSLPILGSQNVKRQLGNPRVASLISAWILSKTQDNRNPPLDLVDQGILCRLEYPAKHTEVTDRYAMQSTLKGIVQIQLGAVKLVLWHHWCM